MERLSGIKIHIDRVESHKRRGSLRVSNVPLGADHSGLLPRFKIELHKRFKTFGHTCAYTPTYEHTLSACVIMDKEKYELKDQSINSEAI